MMVQGAEARARIGRLVERIAILEAALEQCRALADKASPATAHHYCEQIEHVASAALDHQDAV